jgi:hypothetical protein
MDVSKDSYFIKKKIKLAKWAMPKEIISKMSCYHIPTRIFESNGFDIKVFIFNETSFLLISIFFIIIVIFLSCRLL